jgi:small subunit ribosomal protein S12
MKPQMKGICIKAYTIKSKKPNSALRKIIDISINKKIIKAFIPGYLSKKTIIKNTIVLIIKKKLKDCTGVKYRIIKIY